MKYKKRNNAIYFKGSKAKEQSIQRGILYYLQLHGIYAWKNNTVGIYKKDTGSYIPAGKRGVSDIIGILPDGKFLAIEVKTESTRNNLTKYQKEFLKDISDNNGISFVAWSVEMVDEILKERGYIK